MRRTPAEPRAHGDPSARTTTALDTQGLYKSGRTLCRQLQDAVDGVAVPSPVVPAAAGTVRSAADCERYLDEQLAICERLASLLASVDALLADLVCVHRGSRSPVCDAWTAQL